MAICYTYRSIPALDSRKIKALRKVFYKVIVENKLHGLGEETSFEFKYVPDFHTTTSLGNEIEHATGWKQSGVELRNLNTLLVTAGVFGMVCWWVWSVLRNLIG